jgi:cytochrome b involved in lipid metabolism
MVRETDTLDALVGEAEVISEQTVSSSTATAQPEIVAEETKNKETQPIVSEETSESDTRVARDMNGYTLAEVSVHADESSCWSIIGENVYDLTAFVEMHPGGESKILRICGTDGTPLFEDQHGGESKPEKILAKYRVGAYRE